MKEWSDRQVEFYFAGIDQSDYPAVFWERIRPRLAGCQSLLDIGCGPGAFALRALADGYFVQAVDSSAKCLRALEHQAKGRGCSDRCRLIPGDWLDPSLEIEPADVCISANSTGGGIGSPAGIAKIFSYAKKAVFFVVPYERERADFLSRKLFERAGLPVPTFQNDYRTIITELTAQGITPEWQVFSYDFGMPLYKEGLEACARFLQEKLEVFPLGTVKEHLESIRTIRNGQDWIPNPKKSVLISWTREV